MKQITNNEMEAITALMDDDVREMVHNAIAPCSNEEFLKAYCGIKPSFEDVLKSEFNIELEETFDYEKEMLHKRCDELQVKYEGKLADINTLFTLEMEEAVKSVVNCGMSGLHLGYKMYTVYLVNDEDFVIYCED
jgi:hypothetical protein